MKYLNTKILCLLLVLMLLCSYKSSGQNSKDNSGEIMGTVITTGNNATGSSGTVTYSIGQVFYTYIGQSVYNVAQGIQHQENVQAIKDKDALIEVKTEMFIFPNPTTDFVNLSMTGFELKNGKRSYQLYDMNGRFLKESTIDQNETKISLSDLGSSIYILQVYVNNEVFKTFKIIKK